jgi:diacylglycerol kinase (ATP)
MESQYKGKTGIIRIWNAFGYSMAGLRAAYRYEAAFRQEVLLALILIPAAFWFGSSALERALLIACVFLVLIVELANTAIEAVTDRISTDEHALAKRAKDIGSAAVLIALINMSFVWFVVLVD